MRCEQSLKGISGFNWKAKDNRVVINCPPRKCLDTIGILTLTRTRTEFSYLNFDIISDLALGVAFGMIDRQQDSAPISLSSSTKASVKNINPIRLNATGGQGATALGPYPPWAQKLLLFCTPFNIPSLISLYGFRKTASAAVDARVARMEKEGLGNQERGADLLDKLFEIKDADGSRLSRQEIDAQAFVVLSAGSDTTSK
jgi:cytochrome P450